MPGPGYRERILVCHRADLASFVPWCVDAVVVGRVHVDHVSLLLDASSSFRRDGDRLVLHGTDFASRSQAIADAVHWLGERGEMRTPLGELYPVFGPVEPSPMLQIDRAAVTWFGVRAFGVHLNGFVSGAHGHDGVPGRLLWVAERARGKRTFPGHLDNMVAGGLSIGFSARATLEKECAEEASIPAALAARAVPTGTIGYVQQDGRLLKVDSLVCFDLELPPQFEPSPNDGEVEAFRRLPAALVAESLRGPCLWKPNSALVTLDFLLRHGHLDVELPAAERWHLWQLLRGEVA